MLRFQSHGEARLVVFRYIEGWYHLDHRHLPLGQLNVSRSSRLLTARMIVLTPMFDSLQARDHVVQLEPQHTE